MVGSRGPQGFGVPHPWACDEYWYNDAITYHCATESAMNPATPTKEPETQSFAETAMRMGGKSEEESRRMGAVDKADEQVDRLFRVQTASSPIHKAIWDGKVPLDLFQAPPVAASAPCDVVMEKS